MSGRAFLRALAARLREEMLGSRRAGGDGARRSAHPGTGAQIVPSGRPDETGVGIGGLYGGRSGAYGQGSGAYGPGSGAYGGGSGAYGGGSGAYGGGAKGRQGGGDGAKGVNSGEGRNSGPGGGDGAHRRGGRGRRRARSRSPQGRSPQWRQQRNGWWSVLVTRATNRLQGRNWSKDIDDLDKHVQELERMKHLSERIYNLGTWFFEALVSATVTISIASVAFSEKLKSGSEAVKVKVLELKDVVKDKLSPSKTRRPKVPGNEQDAPFTPHPLEFSP